MPNPLLPPGELLLLTIDRVIERECESCAGIGINDDVYNNRVDCPACHGFGRVTRRLRGWVEIVCGADTIGLWIGRNPIILQPTDYHMTEFVGEIVAAYRDGTLPPAIAANLTETDNKQEDE